MTPAPVSNGNSTARAVMWAFLATAVGKLVTLAGMVVLARLIAPAEFGLLGFALVFLTWAETIGDLGTGMALVYWPNRREDAAQVTFWLNMIMGWTWFGLTWLLAPWVAAFFHNADGIPILHAIAWAFPLKYLGNTHDALFRKDLQFRSLILPETCMATTKAIVSIALAYSGYGVWSLVWGHLAGVATWSSLLWIRSAWRPRLTLPRDLVRPMLTYGRGIVAVNLLAAVTHRVDLLIVGRTLGEAALGFYQMAYKIPEMSITIIIWVAARVLFPTFSRLQSQPRELNRAYLSALRYLSLVTLPAAAALVVLARPLVLTLFGSQWEPVVPILRALAVYTGIRSLGSHAGDVLKAAGRPGQLAMLGVLKAAMVVPAVWLASSYGTSAVASAMASVVGVNVLLNLYLIHRLTGLGTGEIVAALRASVLATAAAAMGWVGWIQMAGDGAGSFRLLAAIGFGATIYLATLRLLDPGLYREVLSVLVQRGASANVAPAATATHPPDSSADAMGPA